MQFQNVSKRFNSTVAVDDVSLEVGSGEFCSLVGPSGCGKTTLLRIAAGFVRADQGEVYFGGTAAGATPPNHRNLGFVFQSYALFPTKTVAQNIAFSLTLKKALKNDVKARVDHMCALMNLESLQGRYPHELSGGQQQRVALARALISEPPILLLDEPLSALDAKIRARLRMEIRSIVEKLKITAIYVTHDQEEALSISDKVVIMNAGQVQQVGTPLDVYLHPANLFVAQFIGTTNSLACQVLDNGHIRLGDTSVKIEARNNHAQGSQAMLSIRPEHVLLQAPANGGIPAHLSGVSFLGQSVRLTLKTLGDQSLMVDMPTVEWLASRSEPGAALSWTMRPEFASLFSSSPSAEA